MKKSLLVLLSFYLYFFSLKAGAQVAPEKLGFALETNTLSWLSGHGGPDLKFILIKGRWQWYAGLKVPFYHTYPVEGMPEDNLLHHRQRFDFGIDPVIGFRATFGSFQIGSFIQYGKYYYNNSRLICVNGTSEVNGYTVCESIGVNNFKEVTGRFGTGLECQFRIFNNGKFSMHAGNSLQLNFISSHYQGFVFNSQNGINGVHDSRPEIHREFDKMMLENISMTNNQNRAPSFDKVRIAPKLFLHFRYIL